MTRGIPSVRWATVATAGLLVLATASAAAGGGAVTQRVSVSNSGQQAFGDFGAGLGDISADGRFVAFHSEAPLAVGDSNRASDVYIRDRVSRTTTPVSVVSGTGRVGNADSDLPDLSADGRFVAFQSVATNLVPNDSNGSLVDVFVHDRQTRSTTLVSVSSTGRQANAGSLYPSISDDGRYVAFISSARNLTPTSGSPDSVFVRDRLRGTTTLVSVSSAGRPGSGAYYRSAAISPDGRYVTFGTSAANLVPGDTNQTNDVFRHDRQTGTTTRVSVSSAEVQGNDYSAGGEISAGGRYVTFTSYANNLVGGDTNGQPDVFLRDVVAGTTTRVSVTAGGGQQAQGALFNAITPDARYIAYDSGGVSSNVYRRDRVSGATVLISVPSAGGRANGPSVGPRMSASGQEIAFSSQATNLVPGDTNGIRDVFVRDLTP